MEVGLTRKRVMQGLILSLVIGLLALLFALISIFLNKHPGNSPSTLKKACLMIFLLLMPSCLWLFLSSILCSITLRINDGIIEQVLWRRFVLKRQPISNLTKITGSGFSAMVLHFSGGAKIALPGIHAEDEYQFRMFLDELRPELGLLS